jgi:hypothetical protein
MAGWANCRIHRICCRERRGDVTDDNHGTNLSLTFFRIKTEAYVVAFRIESDGKMQIVAWDVEQDDPDVPTKFGRLYETDTDRTTNLFAMTTVPTEQPTLVTAVRTQSGVMKVILWQYTTAALCT